MCPPTNLNPLLPPIHHSKPIFSFNPLNQTHMDRYLFHPGGYNHYELNHNYIPNQILNNRQIMHMDTSEMIKLLIKQFDLYLQLLIQNVLLTNDENIKYRGYLILFNFYMTRQRFFNSKVPEFEINFSFSNVYIIFFTYI